MGLRTLTLTLTGLLLVGCVVSATRQEGADENIFRYIGYAWFRAHELPYRDAFENKPPGIFALWGLVWLCADGSRFVGRLLGILANIISAVLLGKLATRVWNRPVGVLSGALFLSAACSGEFHPPFSDTETFGTLFALGALSLVWPPPSESGTRAIRPRRAAIAGLLCGVAVLFKPVFAVEGALVLGLIAYSGAPVRRRALAAAAMIAGGLAPVALCLAYFQAQDALAEFFEVVIGSLSAPGTIPRRTLLSRFGHASGAILDYCGRPVALPLIVFGALSVHDLRRSGHPARVLACLFWLTGVYLAIATQGHAYEHQFRQLLPPLSLLAGAALPTMVAERRTAGGATAGPSGLAAALIGVAVGVTVLYVGLNAWHPAAPGARPRDIALWSGSPEEQRAVQLALERLTRPTDRIWCYPTTRPYSDARRLAATRHFTPMFLSRPEAQYEVLSSLAAGRARLVALNMTAIQQAYIPRCFEVADRPAFHAKLEALLRDRFVPRAVVGAWDIYEFAGPGPIP